MAVLANGLETIDLGSTAWRVVCNNNFENIYAKSELYVKDDLYIKTDLYTQSQLYTRTELDSRTVEVTHTEDSVYSVATKGIVLKDRTLGTSYRLFVDNGVLDIEAV